MKRSFIYSLVLFRRLRDESSHVRKNTLMVLTHLILNDMVKVKGQISEMATCLEDKDSRISDLAKLFFLELSKKVTNTASRMFFGINPDSSPVISLRVRFFGKIQIRILVSKNGFCVSLPKSENGLITD